MAIKRMHSCGLHSNEAEVSFSNNQALCKMVSPSIFQFVLQHFVMANVRSVTIFNCWAVESQVALAQVLSATDIFAQFVSISRNGALEDFQSRFLRHQKPVLGVFLDLNCSHSEELLSQLKSSSLRLFSSHYRWVLLNEGDSLELAGRLFGYAKLCIDADITYALVGATQQLDNASFVSVYDVYNNGQHIGGKLNITADREWRCSAVSCQVQRYLSELHKRSKYSNRCSMRDVTKRMVTIVTKLPADSPEAEMRAYMTSIDNPLVDGIQRFGYQLMMTLVDLLNCNISLHFTPTWSTGEIFGGGIGEIINGTSDIISSGFILTFPRLQYLSVLNEMGTFRSVCMFRTPRNSGVNGGVFLEPFSTSVWIIFASLLLLTALMLWCIFFVESHRMHLYWSYIPSFLSACLICFGSACFQGSHLIPLSIGGRMAFLSLSLVTFFMYNYYTSMVVSSLLGSPVKSKIKTLGQLADSSLEVGIEPLSYTMVYLNTSTLAEVRKFVRRKVEPRSHSPDLWIPVEKGVKRVRDQPGFVYIFEASTGYAHVERLYEPHQICDLNEFMLRPERSLYMMVPKTSSYKELYRLRTLRLLETGIYFKMKRFWIRSQLNCYANNFIVDVGMEYAAPLFFLLLFVYACVVVVLLLEMGYKRYTLRGATEISHPE